MSKASLSSACSDLNLLVKWSVPLFLVSASSGKSQSQQVPPPPHSMRKSFPPHPGKVPLLSPPLNSLSLGVVVHYSNHLSYQDPSSKLHLPMFSAACTKVPQVCSCPLTPSPEWMLNLNNVYLVRIKVQGKHK